MKLIIGVLQSYVEQKSIDSLINLDIPSDNIYGIKFEC